MSWGKALTCRLLLAVHIHMLTSLGWEGAAQGQTLAHTLASASCTTPNKVTSVLFLLPAARDTAP